VAGCAAPLQHHVQVSRPSKKGSASLRRSLRLTFTSPVSYLPSLAHGVDLEGGFGGIQTDHGNLRTTMVDKNPVYPRAAADMTRAGYQVMAMIRKGQVHNLGGRAIPAQATLIAELFEFAA
jgi:hypothetical protein